MHYYNNTEGIIIFNNNNSLTKNIKVDIKTYLSISWTMEIWHFFVIFNDFFYEMCVQKYHLYFCDSG